MIHLIKLTTSALVAGGLLVIPSLLLAGHPDTSKVADGVMMHLGVVHSKVLVAHPEFVPPDHLIKSGKNVYHVLVSLYDQETGQNISGAKVKIHIAPMATGGTMKKLEPMKTAGFTTYCNYFKMQPQVTYNIDITVQRMDSPKIAKARFVHHPFAD
jgi:hypothetical protein